MTGVIILEARPTVSGNLVGDARRIHRRGIAC
jgi:hypothetical protein